MSYPGGNEQMSSSVQRCFAWCGIAWTIVFGIGFWAIAGFIPPPSPNDSAQEIAAIYAEDRTRIRVGLVVSAISAGLYALWSAGVSMQLRRIEGRWSGLAYAQLALGTLVVLELLFPMMFWLAASFRSERDPEDVQLMNDMGWMPFVGITSTVLLQALVIAAGILLDRRPEPVFPRWVAYLNIWAGLLFTPGSFIVFFKTGPMAWDGVIALYIPIVVFGLWIVVMSHQLLRTAAALDAPGEPAVVTSGT